MKTTIERRYYVHTNGYDFILWENNYGIDCRDDKCFEPEYVIKNKEGKYNFTEIERILIDADGGEEGYPDARERCGDASKDELLAGNDIIMTMTLYDDGSYDCEPKPKKSYGIVCCHIEYPDERDIKDGEAYGQKAEVLEEYSDLTLAVEHFLRNYRKSTLTRGERDYFDKHERITSLAEFFVETLDDGKPMFIGTPFKSRQIGKSYFELFRDVEGALFPPSKVVNQNGEDVKKSYNMFIYPDDILKTYGKGDVSTVKEIKCDSPIKVAREDCGYTQKQACIALQIPITTLTQWEQGVAYPTEYLERLVVEELYRKKSMQMSHWI